MKKIAIFASGSGSNAENIARFFKEKIWTSNAYIQTKMMLMYYKEHTTYWFPVKYSLKMISIFLISSLTTWKTEKLI